MRLTKYGHSCLRIEDSGAVLVIDPGMFSEPEALDGVDAVLITHEHADHLNADALADALAKRPSVTIYTNSAVLAKLDALKGAVTAVESGQAFEAAGFPVRAYGGWHAVIHRDLPPVPNLGFLVADRVYHPGDSFDVPAGVHVDTLFVPISGPWLQLSDAVEFVRAVAPRRAYALHDGLLNEAGLTVYNRNLELLSKTEYGRLAPGQTIEVGR